MPVTVIFLVVASEKVKARNALFIRCIFECLIKHGFINWHIKTPTFLIAIYLAVISLSAFTKLMLIAKHQHLPKQTIKNTTRRWYFHYWWALADLNRGPKDYESSALTN